MKPEVYWLGEAPPLVEGVVRYSGDVDEFVAVAHQFLATHRDGVYDAPMGLAPPELGWWRWVETPGGEFEKYLDAADGPGAGAWPGALIRVVQIGCSLCQRIGGTHLPGCLNENITSLVTCQFRGQATNGPTSEWWIHAVRCRRTVPGRAGGTPGPTLCDIFRFAPDAPSWSLAGGTLVPGGAYKGCYRCGQVALAEFGPGITISGTREFAETFARDTDVALAPHLISGGGEPMDRNTHRRPTFPAHIPVQPGGKCSIMCDHDGIVRDDSHQAVVDSWRREATGRPGV